MILTLILKDLIYNQSLPEKIQGQYWVKSSDEKYGATELLEIEGAGTSWIIKSTKAAYLCGKNNKIVRECALEKLCFYRVKIAETQEDALLYCEEETTDRKTFQKLIFTSKANIGIGRSVEHGIVYENIYVSSSHAVLEVSESKIMIRDTGSSNGTFVNGHRVREKLLVPGDVIFIMGLKIIIGKGFIALNNPDGKVHIKEKSLLAYKPQPIMNQKDSMNVSDRTIKFYRSPRLKREVKTFELSIDPPPGSQKTEQLPMLLTIGPSATMGVASLATASTTVVNLINGKNNLIGSLPMLVMSVAMLCGTLLWPTIIKKYEKKKSEQKEQLRQEKYKAYIDSIKSEINNETSYQQEILNENFVPIDACLSRIKLVQRNLWERTSNHNDFLMLRLGNGSLPLNCEIKCQKRKFSLEEDNLQEIQYRISEQSHMIKDVPITISMRDDKVTGVIGKKMNTVPFAKSLLLQTVALHSYDEVKIVIICGETDSSWDFARWLPHIWDDDHKVRFFAKCMSDLKQMSMYMEREIAVRSANRDKDSIDGPHYVVFALDQELAEKADFLKMLYKQKDYCGVSVLAMSDELKNLPKECKKIVELSQQRSRVYDRDDVAGNFCEFSPEYFVGTNEEEYAVQLANIILETSSDTYTLPTAITFTETYDVGKVEHLNILSRWRENDPTTSLDAVIGVDEYGEKFSLDIHEKAHGPHGLIAGTTGSGKSEFIMTYILAMAVNYHPSEVAFILIDYKGGGMAKAFERLPHTAGIITNLDGSEVNRSLVSIKSELRRRQALFTQTSKQLGMSNIDIYKYQRLVREGAVSEPLPHLIIISDEFAELKAQQPDFMAELISTARIGRSLGVHLILATQKPTGVVDDQIVSNTKFRICLKVQDKQDSMEMLKRPEAAELTTTGRFYLQVGNNELFKLGQSAWSGAKYIPSDRVEHQTDNSVEVLANSGRTLRKVRPAQGGGTKTISQIDAINNCITSIAQQEGFKQRMLWCPSMPSMITVEELEHKYPDANDGKVTPLVGEYDIPEMQKQEVLRIPFEDKGNVVVYGSSGGGKTTFVTTMLYSLISRYTPEQVNIYAMDFSAQTLSMFSAAPHVGDVIMPEEEEKINNLFKMLGTEIKKRKLLFQEYGGDFESYNKISGSSVPCIIVVIHNYTGLLESYDVEDSIAVLSREGAKRGIFFVVTAQSASAIRHRTLQNFGQIYVMRMNDPLDYSSILGNVGGLVPAPYLGRGIFKEDGTFEFQTAHVAAGEQIKFIRSVCKSAADEWEGECAFAVPVLPEKVDCDELASAIVKSKQDVLPIAVDREKLTTIAYPVFSSVLTWVLSETGDNSIFIQGFAEAAALKGNAEVVVIDPLDAFIADRGKQYEYVTGAEEINAAVDSVFTLMLNRHKELKSDPNAEFNRMLVIINSISSLEDTLTEENHRNFLDALNNASTKYSVFFAVSADSSYFSGQANKQWVRSLTTFRDVIWIGGGITNNFRLQINKAPRNIREGVEEGSGFVLMGGTAVSAKLLTSRYWIQED